MILSKFSSDFMWCYLKYGHNHRVVLRPVLRIDDVLIKRIQHELARPENRHQWYAKPLALGQANTPKHKNKPFSHNNERRTISD